MPKRPATILFGKRRVEKRNSVPTFLHRTNRNHPVINPCRFSNRRAKKSPRIERPFPLLVEADQKLSDMRLPHTRFARVGKPNSVFGRPRPTMGTGESTAEDF